jgi:hypothetical protein
VEVTMRRSSTLLMLIGAMGLAASAAAHGGHSHADQKITGAVKAVHTAMNHVRVTTKDGKTAEFYVNAATKYLRGTTKQALSDLTPGTRVVVDVKEEGGKMIATSVRLGTATGATLKSSTQQP